MTSLGSGDRAARPGTHLTAIAALAASAFVYVTAETLPVGLLPQISGGLGVSEADVGLLLTSYAGVAALSTIPLTALTLRVPRHRLIPALTVVFTVSQLAAALAPTFLLLTTARLVCALAHGVFWSAIAPVAARLAPPSEAGRATSLVFAGNSLALVLGVPLGTALGQLAGWRVAFAVLATAGALSTIALVRVLPALPPLPADRTSTAPERLRAAMAIIRSRSLAPVFVVSLVLVVGHFAAYTYIAPLVRRDAGFTGLALSALLLGYGACGLIGTLVVGRLVDSRPGPALAVTVGVIAISLAMLGVVHGPLTVVAVLAWGAAFTSVPVSLQSAVLRVAPGARDAASAVYVVAFQIGIAAGALLGDRLVVAGRLGALPILGSGLAVLSAAVVIGARRTFPLRTWRPEASGAP